jgi:hypothetical protein
MLMSSNTVMLAQILDTGYLSVSCGPPPTGASNQLPRHNSAMCRHALKQPSMSAQTYMQAMKSGSDVLLLYMTMNEGLQRGKMGHLFPSLAKTAYL